ncbi:VWA domain-containing protein [Granulicella mallensis]|uniref:VWFA-related domain-containing protein n=1 Tax=Granulicella mallensis (strain ATCC BAA-1857 / DSM 23137 / MP5ACTX8) TaxID=682795 RepID=G8NS21_GRAMM|nr:VWA domain-containing protein [Granulicella mallensis]AEU36229.1 VWFA-related domain-containing protein [Granulicella mallensis MP5ACTX8]
MRLAAIALAAVLLPALAMSQTTVQQPAPIERHNPEIPTLHVESRLVSVALNVVDEQGAPVPGLSAADFEVAEDGKPQRIANFDRESSTPLEIVLAIDASESVFNDEHLEREAAKKFMASLLRKQDQIDLMDFADDVDELVSFTSDVQKIDSGLGRIHHGDATALYDAVYLASQRLGETPTSAGQRRVLVLITDGENTTHHGSYDAALEQAQRAGAMIYALIIVPVSADAGRNTGGEHALIQLARDTGGKYYYVEDKHDLAPAFQHVSDDLRTQYTVGYYAPQKGLGRDNLRHIQLQLKDPALRARYTLRYRTSYYANR